MTTPIVSKKESRYHHGDLYQSLLNAALVSLEKGTLASLSLRRLARECGVSQTAPYRHFASKEHLMAALAEHGAEILLKQLTSGFKKSTDAWQDLINLMTQYLRFSHENVPYFQLIFNARMIDRRRYPSLLRVCRRVKETLSEPLKRLCTPAMLDTQVALFWSYLHGLSTLSCNHLLEFTPASQQMQIEAFVTQIKAQLSAHASEASGALA